MRSGFRPLVLIGALLLAGCAEDARRQQPVATMEFETSNVCIATPDDTLRLEVELAATEPQRAQGLMERDYLADDAGMLFTYDEPQPPEDSFWMYRTRIPLDIAFLGPDGEIRAIRTMQPCTSPDPRWCESYPAGVPFQAALEVNAGFFAAHGVEVGDRVLQPSARCPAT